MCWSASAGSTTAKSQAEPLQTQPSWMKLANSSNPFSQFIPLDNSSSDPNPWAATPTSTQTGSQQVPAEPLGDGQEMRQEKSAGFGSWNTFDQPGPVTYPALENSRHPDAPGRLSQQSAAAPTAAPQQQQQQQQQQQHHPAPLTGVGAQQPTELDWAFGPGGQAPQSAPQQQQPAAAADDIWSSLDRNQQQPLQKREPRGAIVDSWASFDAPSDPSGLGAPVASQQTSQGISNVNSQDSWNAFGPGNSGAGSSAGAGATAGFPSSSSQQHQGRVIQTTSADRKGSVEEIPAQDLGLEGLRITAEPKPEISQGHGYTQEGFSQGPAQPLPKPKRSSTNQFGSVFAPGSANSVSKLTNIFKKDKDKKGRQSMDTNQAEQQGALADAAPQSSQAPSVSLPSTPQRGQATQGQGEVSEVDLWRPQSTEERQQCMDAFDYKVSLLHTAKLQTKMLLCCCFVSQAHVCRVAVMQSQGVAVLMLLAWQKVADVAAVCVCAGLWASGRLGRSRGTGPVDPAEHASRLLPAGLLDTIAPCLVVIVWFPFCLWSADFLCSSNCSLWSALAISVMKFHACIALSFPIIACSSPRLSWGSCMPCMTCSGYSGGGK